MSQLNQVHVFPKLMLEDIEPEKLLSDYLVLKNSNCPQNEREEILELSTKIKDILCYHKFADCEHLRYEYEQVEDILEDDTDWKEIVEKLRQLLKKCDKLQGRRVGITVEEADGTQYFLRGIHREESVDSLKDRIEYTSGIPKENFILTYNGGFLTQGQSLAHLKLHNDSKIQLLRLKEGEPRPTNITKFVGDKFNSLYGQIEFLFRKFPKVFEDCTRVISEKDILKVSNLIGSWWKLLGTELGLGEAALDHITSDNQKERLRIVGMLGEWRKMYSHEATTGKLFGAIKNLGVNCDLERLKQVILI